MERMQPEILIRRLKRREPSSGPYPFSAVFADAVRGYFGTSTDIRAVTGLVGRIRPGDQGSPRREAEAAIRALLGEAVSFDYAQSGAGQLPGDRHRRAQPAVPGM